MDLTSFPLKMGGFLMNDIRLGRGVHRKLHFPIQKSRSNFGYFSRFYAVSGNFGVGVIYWWFSLGLVK